MNIKYNETVIDNRYQVNNVRRCFMTLAMLNEGDKSVIVECKGKDEMKKHLWNLGFVPEQEVCVVGENASGMIVLVKEARIALNRGIASMIQVK